jgi:hypothetical protein
MQRLDVSGAVRHIYIYVIRRQRVKPVGYKARGPIEITSVDTSKGHIKRVDTLMTYLRTKFHVSISGGSILTITERKGEENLRAIDVLVTLHFTK